MMKALCTTGQAPFSEIVNINGNRVVLQKDTVSGLWSAYSGVMPGYVSLASTEDDAIVSLARAIDAYTTNETDQVKCP